MTICIRQAAVSDWGAIRRFIFEAYGKLALFKDYPRWHWQFVANPFQPPSLEDVSVWIAEDDGRVVGQIAVQRATIQVASAEYSAGWIVDVMILPTYRGRSLGHQLYAAVASEFPMLITLTMAPATRRMALKAGCVTLGRVQQYTKIVHLSDTTVKRYLLDRAAHRPSLLRIFQIACSPFRLDWLVSRLLNVSHDLNLNRFFRSRTPIPGKHANLEIDEVETFGDELDCFWAKVRHQYPAIAVRNARFLNWRYVNAPDLNYRRFVARRAGHCIGYIVIRRTSIVELPAGVIVDFLTHSNDMEAVTFLMQHAVNVFGNDVEFLDCATSSPVTGTVLQNLGFYRTRMERPTVVCGDPVLRRHVEALKSKWIFTKGDQDWDQVVIR